MLTVINCVWQDCEGILCLDEVLNLCVWEAEMGIEQGRGLSLATCFCASEQPYPSGAVRDLLRIDGLWSNLLTLLRAFLAWLPCQ